MCRITVNRTVKPVSFGKDLSAIKQQHKQQQQQQQNERRRNPPEPPQPQPQPQESPPHHGDKSEEAQRIPVCAICEVNTGSYNLNYGANTCLSCRAFFRRAIQKTRNPSFACKFDGNCTIVEETRRCCKKCRFDKCLRAGMRAECVMQGEEIHQRFFKYIQKKKNVDKKASTMARFSHEDEEQQQQQPAPVAAVSNNNRGDEIEKVDSEKRRYRRSAKSNGVQKQRKQKAKLVDIRRQTKVKRDALLEAVKELTPSSNEVSIYIEKPVTFLPATLAQVNER